MWNICLRHNATRLTLSNSMSFMLNFCVQTDNFCQCDGGIMQLHSSVSKQTGFKLSKRFHRWCHALPHHYFGGRYIFLQVHQVQSKAIDSTVQNIKEHSAGELHNISHLLQITKTKVNISQSINSVFCVELMKHNIYRKKIIISNLDPKSLKFCFMLRSSQTGS